MAGSMPIRNLTGIPFSEQYNFHIKTGTYWLFHIIEIDWKFGIDWNSGETASLLKPINLLSLYKPYNNGQS